MKANTTKRLHLTEMADKSLPKKVLDHLENAELTAENNLRMIVEKKSATLDKLGVKIDEIDSPKFSAEGKFHRLRFIASEWTKNFTSETACSSGCSH